MRSFLPNSQARALAIAMVGAALAAVTTMLLPVSLLEGIAGSSGLSELVPAAKAPLGDTARALIAFSAGAIMLAVLSYLLLRAEAAVAQPTNKASGLLGAAKQQGGDIAKTLLAKMPWNKSADDIRELGDLPKLRVGDVHPDAPARRPLFASQDLPTLELSEKHLVDAQTPQEPEQLVEAVSEAAEPEVPVLASEPGTPEPSISAPLASSFAADSQPSIAEMVAQLETAVALRRQKLAELEAVAADLLADAKNADEPSDAIVEPASFSVAEPEPEPEPEATVAEFRPMRRPALEAVPTVAVQDDNIDSALAAALATLHRINAGAR
jgi:hypothetical protein